MVLYLQRYCLMLLFLTAIVFVVHAYPLRFVSLVVVGMGSVIVLRFAVGYPQTHNLCKR